MGLDQDSQPQHRRFPFDFVPLMVAFASLTSILMLAALAVRQGQRNIIGTPDELLRWSNTVMDATAAEFTIQGQMAIFRLESHGFADNLGATDDLPETVRSANTCFEHTRELARTGVTLFTADSAYYPQLDDEQRAIPGRWQIEQPVGLYQAFRGWTLGPWAYMALVRNAELSGFNQDSDLYHITGTVKSGRVLSKLNITVDPVFCVEDPDETEQIEAWIDTAGYLRRVIIRREPGLVCGQPDPGGEIQVELYNFKPGLNITAPEDLKAAEGDNGKVYDSSSVVRCIDYIDLTNTQPAHTRVAPPAWTTIPTIAPPTISTEELVEIETRSFVLQLTPTGQVQAILDKKSSNNYAAYLNNWIPPVLSIISTDNHRSYPTTVAFNNDRLTMTFREEGQISLLTQRSDKYIIFEFADIEMLTPQYISFQILLNLPDLSQSETPNMRGACNQEFCVYLVALSEPVYIYATTMQEGQSIVADVRDPSAIEGASFALVGAPPNEISDILTTHHLQP
jgi:hypothetical protein